MKIYQAETGILVEINSPKNIIDLQSQIQDSLSVPISAQIIITNDGVQLKDDDLNIHNELFLFNRSILDPSKTSDSVHMSIEIEAPVPSNILQVITHSQGPPDHLDTYQKAFRSHVDYGRDLLKVLKKHRDTCLRLRQEQIIQDKSLAIAILNLQKHSALTLETFQAFNQHAQSEFKKHSSLLHNFPLDLQTLGKIPIHYAIVSDNKKLDDFVPKEKLFAWVKRCQAVHDHLTLKTSQLVETMQTIKAGCDAESLQRTGIDFSRLSSLVDSLQEIVSSAEQIQLNLERDSAKIDLMVGDFLQDEQKSQAIEHLYNIHIEEYLPEITQYDRQVRETVLYFSDSKNHLTHVLKHQLQTIAHYQSIIASVIPTITDLSNTLNVQSEALLQLLHVHRMAPAWGAALVEIVRRKEYVKVFLKKAKEMANILSQFRANEERRRETFKSEISRYLPPKLITGLDDSPPYCEISVSNTKDSLPDLGPDDIAAFETLVSSLKSSQMRGDGMGSISSDSISKLQATMIKMMPQLQNIIMDFEKIILKSGLSERLLKYDDDSRRLKGSPSRAFDITANLEQKAKSPDFPGSKLADVKHDDTIKAYENRIKTLEAVLQEKYYSPEVDADQFQDKINSLEESLENEKKLTKSLQEQVEELKRENKKLSEGRDKSMNLLEEKIQLEELYSSVLEQVTQLNQDLHISNTQNQEHTQLLFEVFTHLNSCIETLKTAEDSMVHFDSVSTPGPIQADNLRQMMRKVEDNIISQMALLENCKNSLSDSTAASAENQAVAVEIVDLLQKVNDLDINLRENEIELTKVQAHEAVLEAECSFLNTMLQRAKQDYEKQKEKLESALVIEKQNAADLSMYKEKLAEADILIATLETNLKDVKSQALLENEPFQLLLREKESTLLAYKVALEDWAIISRLCIEQIQDHHYQWGLIQKEILKEDAMQCNLQEILDIDPELFPQSVDQYLQSMNVLMKTTYDRISQTSIQNTDRIVKDIIGTSKIMRLDLSHRISFQKFDINDLCLFIPTKKAKVWAAFHIDNANYYLDLDSHNGFSARVR